MESNVSCCSRDLINLTHDEIEHFGGNCLEVRSETTEGKGPATKLHLAISSNAVENLSAENWRRVNAAFDSLIVVNIRNIEKIGGGGFRCMLAANHLLDKNQ